MTNVTRETWQKVMALSSGLDLPLGPNATDRYLFDPKRMCFFLSRYKFAAKMLRRCHSIVDVGCGDGMGTVTYLSDTRASWAACATAASREAPAGTSTQVNVGW